MDTNTKPEGSGTGSAPAPGDEALRQDQGAPGGAGGMPRTVEAFLVGQGDAGKGGADDKKTEAKTRRPLDELTKRVLARWGAGPFKALALLVGLQVGVDKEDAELLGEVTVEGVRHSVVDVDEATEARWRVPLAYGLCALDAFLASVERRWAARDGAPRG